MKIEQPNLREVAFDCPWTGHQLSQELVLMNKNSPFIGMLCLKCGSMIYVKTESSGLIGPSGMPIPHSPKAE